MSDFYFPNVLSEPISLSDGPAGTRGVWAVDSPDLFKFISHIEAHLLVRWCRTSKRWWSWQDNVWVMNHEESMRKWLCLRCKEGRIGYWKMGKNSSTYTPIFDGIEYFERRLRDVFADDMAENTNRSNPIWVGFQDCDVAMRKGKVLEISPICPSHYVTYRLPIPAPLDIFEDPISYYAEPSNRPSRTIKAIEQITEVKGDVRRSEAQSRIIWTYYGASMLDGSGALTRALTLLGKKGCGKSAILDLIQFWIPKSYISAVQPSELGDRFSTSALIGKRINMVDDVEESDITKTGVIKSLVQGKGVRVEFKGGANTNVDFDRLLHIYASNERGIRSPGANDAIYDRFTFIKCDNSFRNTSNENKNLVHELWHGKEGQPGESIEIIKFAIATYLTVIKEEWHYGDIEDSSNKELTSIINHNNRFLDFLNNVLVHTGNEKDIVRIDAIAGAYGDYKNRMRYNDRIAGLKPTIDSLPAGLKDCLEDKQVRVAGGRTRIKVLVGFRYQPLNLDGDPNITESESDLKDLI